MPVIVVTAEEKRRLLTILESFIMETDEHGARIWHEAKGAEPSTQARLQNGARYCYDYAERARNLRDKLA